MKSILYILLALIVARCGLTPGTMNPEQLRSQPTDVLCHAYSNNKDAEVASELERRNLFTAREWQSINRGTIFLGMREPALGCSWGYPGTYGGINRSTNRYGTRAQWVYRPCRSCGAQYVYTEDGEVTGWSD